MREIPILFKDEMVRAILSGAKTQTRRMVRALVDKKRPYGAGDRLWVREAFDSRNSAGERWKPSDAAFVVFRDGAQVYRDGTYSPPLGTYAPGAFDSCKWRPGIHMPRWASRITLEVLSTRVERLRDISEEDAQAEGVTPIGDVGCPCEGDAIDPGPHLAKCAWSHLDIDPDSRPYTAAFAVLWDSINRDGINGWARDPWVWRIEFREVSRG